MECAKGCSGVRKVKKKQVKDELDRFKQAEKKRRRLEKALATSAAIRSELEKKKIKKQEEQKRLDEEGAAIAEAVALRVLVDEDLDDSSKNKLEKDEGFEPLDFVSKFDRFTGGMESSRPHRDLSGCSPEVIGRVCDGHNRFGFMWNDCSIKWRQQGFCPQYHGPYLRDIHKPYYYERSLRTADISPGVVAEQAISSLRIAEDEYVDTFRFNPMLRW